MAAYGHFENKFKKSCVLIWNGEKCDRKWFSVIQNGPNRTSKMAQIALPKWLKSDFQNSRRRPFWKKRIKIKLRIERKWREMRSKVIFDHPRWTPVTILWKKIQANKSYLLIWNGEKCDRKWFSVIQNGRKMATGGHFAKLIVSHPKWPQLMLLVLWKPFIEMLVH